MEFEIREKDWNALMSLLRAMTWGEHDKGILVDMLSSNVKENNRTKRKGSLQAELHRVNQAIAFDESGMSKQGMDMLHAKKERLEKQLKEL